MLKMTLKKVQNFKAFFLPIGSGGGN